MKSKKAVKLSLAALFALSVTKVSHASQEQTNSGEFKLPPPTRYLTDEQIERLTAASQKVEIKPNEYTPQFLKYFHAEIKTAFGGTSYERQIVDMTQSYFGLTVGDKVDDAIANFSKYAGDRRVVVGFNLKTSVVPLLLEDSAKKKIDEVIFQKVKDGAVAAAAISVKNAFEANVHPQVIAGRMTEEEYQAMLAKNITGTTTAVSNNRQLLNSLAAPLINKAAVRIDELQQEMLFQEVSMKFAWSPSKDDSIIIFGTVGKAIVNANSKQGIRAATAFGGWANIGESTQGTGMVHIGVQSAIKNDIKVTFESWVFHNRLPTRSGQTLLFNVVSMPDDVFDNHQDITRLDSNMQKITIEMPSSLAPTKDTVYFTTGDFKGERVYGAGAIIRVLPKISVQVEGTVGRNAVYSSAFMEAILYHVNDKLTLFVANENVSNLKSGYNVTSPKVTPGQVGAASVGAAYVVGKWSLGYDVTAALNATGAVKCFYQNEGMFDQDTCGFDVGMSANVQWR